MSIRVVCPECQQKYQVADSASGKSLKCKSCGATIKIPKPHAPDDDNFFVDVSEADGVADDLPDDEDASADETDAVRPARGRRSSKSKAKRSGPTSLLTKLLMLGAACLGILFICCGGAYFWLSSELKPPAVSAVANEPFPVTTLVTPTFPELGTPQKLGPTDDVSVVTVDLAPANIAAMRPAASMQMRIYLPHGDHQPGSLGCVLVAPAGTNLLTGNSLDDPAYHKETLPYTRAGYVAIMYSLDGAPPPGVEDPSDDQLAACYRNFSAAQAGLANARTALDFVLARLPQVNPKRIFAAGHSSAGTLALLFAAHEPRLKGCIAYAPQTDIAAGFGFLLGLMVKTEKFPGLVDFVHQSSPLTHVGRIQCPVFLFWAADDSVIDPEGLQKFANELSNRRPDVTVRTVPTGDHFEPMINPGMGQAIEWMKSLPGEKPVAGAP
ncbi:MAG: dienelactone hydrolase family protein [Planctomycetes bacterium]|nr:dienelactone hydrolase family protein [Planctomycetota bacterium]